MRRSPGNPLVLLFFAPLFLFTEEKKAAYVRLQSELTFDAVFSILIL